MKRLFDVSISLILGLLTSPVLILAIVCIKVDSKGPVIFKQQRIGRNGRIFEIFKFRSMTVDAENKGPHFTDQNDPRVTRTGRIIRKTSIDELPQLLNVLWGDMSLVGPRPNVPQQRAEYTTLEWTKRHSVLPGITGLAQAKVRSSATAEERTALDLEYVDKATLWYDMWILVLTAKQMVFKGGS